MAHIRQSRPDYGLDFQVEVHNFVKVLPVPERPRRQSQFWEAVSEAVPEAGLTTVRSWI